MQYINATLHALEEEALAEPPHTERTDIQQLRKELENALPHVTKYTYRFPTTTNESFTLRPIIPTDILLKKTNIIKA